MVKIKHKDFIGAALIVLPKLIIDNRLEDLWRKEKPGSPEFTCYNRSFTKDSG